MLGADGRHGSVEGGTEVPFGAEARDRGGVGGAQLSVDDGQVECEDHLDHGGGDGEVVGSGEQLRPDES